MFSSTVKEKNIIPRKLDESQNGNVLIWLLTLYQFIFDFECIIELERAYFDSDVGMSGFGTYRGNSLFSKFMIMMLKTGTNKFQYI